MARRRFGRNVGQWGDMSSLTMIGLLAAACTTLAYVPQVVKTWRTRSTEDISLHMYLLMVTGVALWLVYGLALGNGPLIAANGATLALAASILYVKLRGR
jgi:MtN3 and saliva related transmembrane protein